MLKRQRGQAFILVLILLMVGALVITPALNLAWSGLKGRMAEHTDLMEYYAADGASDYSLWRLAYEPGFASSLTPGVASGPYYIILNGIKAEYSVTAQASFDNPPNDAPALTNYRYKITATVSPNATSVGTPTTFYYNISLQYMYPDVPTRPLTQLQVSMPGKFAKVPGSTTGFTTADPTLLGAGATFQWNFSPGISFNYWEKKSMSFQATYTFASGDNNKTFYHSVSVKAAGSPDSSTGSTAPIKVGNPAETGIPRLSITKTVSPSIIPLGTPTLVTYTISLKNMSSVLNIGVDVVEDVLPEGFAYSPGSDTGFLLIDTSGPDGSYINGRQDLQWKFTPTGIFTINAGQTATATFNAIANLSSSGTYANEVQVKAQGGVELEYSWPTGYVIVPQYDIVSSAGGTTLKVNAQISGGSHVIKSWQVE